MSRRDIIMFSLTLVIAGGGSTGLPSGATAQTVKDITTATDPQPNDPLDELMKELEKKHPSGAKGKSGESEVGSLPVDLLRCKGQITARGSIVILPPTSFEFTGRFNIDKEIFHVAKVNEGDLMKDGRDYAIKSTTATKVTIKAELENPLVSVNELAFSLGTLKISGVGEFAGGYKPMIIKPHVTVDGICAKTKTDNKGAE
jgi:hypothetical protein